MNALATAKDIAAIVLMSDVGMLAVASKYRQL